MSREFSVLHLELTNVTHDGASQIEEVAPEACKFATVEHLPEATREKEQRKSTKKEKKKKRKRKKEEKTKKKVYAVL
jgi:hypothetical protein